MNAIPGSNPLSKGRCAHGNPMSEHCALCEIEFSHSKPDTRVSEPTIAQLTRMAVLLRLVPEGEIVPVQILDILKNQYNAAIAVLSQPEPQVGLPVVAQKDAERYQWLRAGLCTEGDTRVTEAFTASGNENSYPTEAQFDAAIDAAIAAAQGGAA